MRLRIIGLLFFLSTSIGLYSQDPHFSQLENSEWYFNPAMVNNDSLDQVAIKYRNQWPALSGNYVTTTAHYAHYFSKTNGTVYGAYLDDNAARGTLITNRFNLGYAQKIKLGKELMVQLGTELTFGMRSLDWSKLTFGDMIDPRRGFVYETNDIPRVGSGSYLDISGGILVNYYKLFMGFSTHHISEPNESAIGGYSPLPRKYGFQLGYDLVISSQFELKMRGFHYRQAGFRNTLFGGDVAYKGKFNLGYYHRINDAHVIRIGLQGDLIGVYYSNDITISELTTSTAYSHELSTSIRFWTKTPHKKFMNW